MCYLTWVQMQEGGLGDIYAQYGQGVAGSLMALASRLLMQSANQDLGLWLYGGFVRDMIVRNDPPHGMDLDIGLPVHRRGPDAANSMQIVIQVAKLLNMRVKRKMSADRRVCIAFFTTVDQSGEVEVQVRLFLYVLGRLVIRITHCTNHISSY